MVGETLGPYRVLGKLGEGGMGQVYRATDTRLKRQVAIKVLPDAVAADPERLARFQREAEVLAALNHPHIAAIYGLEESNGVQEQLRHPIAKAMIVDVTTDPSFRVSQPRVLYEGPYGPPSPYGQRFLSVQPVEPERDPTQNNVIVNWVEALKRKGSSGS
jgi:serine/threonine protein kinase